MKKLGLIVAVLLVVAAPVWATVNITCTADGNVVTVSYNVVTSPSEPNKVRAFALDITVDSPAKINTITYTDPNYWVYPGSIVIVNGEVNDVGSPDANATDFPIGTLPGLDSNGVTIEMGSLYYPTGDNSPNAPKTGTRKLLKFTVCHVFNGCKVRIRENTVRGGVVLTNPALDPVVNIPSPAYTFVIGYIVPNVVGMTEAAAVTAITGVDSLVVAKTYAWDAVVVKGNVISQVPIGGTLVPGGSTVTIKVSRGPQPTNCLSSDPNAALMPLQITQFNNYVTKLWDPTQWCAYNVTTNPKGGYQCHGDADGIDSGYSYYYRIYGGDLSLIVANWKKKLDTYPLGADPRADIDHKDSGYSYYYRVYGGDLSRIVANWKRKNFDKTGGLPRNCPLTDAKNNAYVTPP